MITAEQIVLLGTEVAKVVNKGFDQLPNHQQRMAKDYFEFEDRLNEEMSRADEDHDDVVIWNERRDLLLNTIMSGIRKKAVK